MRPHPALWLALWLAALAGFIVMAAFASAHNTFPADIWLAHRLQDIHSGFFSDVLNSTAGFADLPLLIFATVVGTVVFFALAGPVPALLVLASVPLGRPFNIAMKALVDRPRPSSSIIRVEGPNSDAAFPSGHAEAAIALYGMLFYLVTVYVKDARVRLPLQLLFAWVIVLTGLQRVYSGAHWPSDVVGGTLLGGLALAALIAAHRLYLTSSSRPESQRAAVR